jgi:hypothetical protein
MSDELKECPFCGGEADRCIVLPGGGTRFGCHECGIRATNPEDWNRRVPPPLAWTSEPPTVPGWYWVMGSSGILRNVQHCNGDEVWSTGQRFAGPIPEPEVTP